MPAATMEGLQLVERQSIDDAGHRTVEKLPKLAQKVSTGELRQALEKDLKVTEKQSGRLEKVFGSTGLIRVPTASLTPRGPVLVRRLVRPGLRHRLAHLRHR